METGFKPVSTGNMQFNTSRMKKRISFILFLIPVLVLPFIMNTSCSTTKSLAAFDVNYTFPKVYFSYSGKAGKLPEVTLYTGKLTINLDSILIANHIPSGFIGSAYLSKMSMVITAPPEATFNWLESVRMIGCTDSTFQTTTAFGSATGINPAAKSIDMVLDKVDLKPILFKNSYWLRILATPSGQIPASTISMYMESAIKLHIEPL